MFIASLSCSHLFLYCHHVSEQNKNKKAVLSQGNRAMPVSPTTLITSLRVANLQKPGFRAPKIPAQNRM